MPSSSRHASQPTYEAVVSSSAEPMTLLEPRISATTAAPATHKLEPGQRLDLLAWRFYGDATQFWKLADENLPADPDELEAPGRIIRVPGQR